MTIQLAERKRWNAEHQRLTALLKNPRGYEQAVELFLSQHAWLYVSKMADVDAAAKLSTLEDELLDGIREETLRQYPVKAPDTTNSIVWHLWHIARIEDMTVNVLIGGREQIFAEGNWLSKLRISCAHTGNGMTEEEAAELSAGIDIDALLDYRIEVGRRTREIVRSMEPAEMKRKVPAAGIDKLRAQNAVKPDAEWLLEYWGKKTFAGLILMPATRHNFLHLNKAIRIKQRIQKKS